MMKAESKTATESKSKRQIAQEEKVVFWQKHIQGWRRSGIRQVDYCREHGLSKDQFTYWKGRFNQKSVAIAADASGASSALSASSASSSISLVPVGVKVNLESGNFESSPKPIPVMTPHPITPQSIVSKPLVVVVDGHYRIEVSGDFESATLGKLVSTLRQL